MDNPFELILEKLAALESKILETNSPAHIPVEILSSDEICKRLSISEPTLISWRRKKKIPFIKIDGIIRYNFPKVVEALENGNKKSK